MPAKLVPTVRTTYTQTQLIQGFIEGWKQLYGEFPKKESIAVIYAQNAIETGSTSSMWNNNIGNVKFVANGGTIDDGKEYMMLANVWEMVNGKKVIFQPPHPATWFRSFPTLAEGIAFHFGFLRNKRYKLAWTAVESGKPAEFSHLLKVAGYYTASEVEYTKAVNAYFLKFMKMTTFETVIESLKEPEPDPVVIITPTPDPVPSPEPTPPPNKSTFESAIGLLFPLLNIFKKK
jgi:hypothetical protein